MVMSSGKRVFRINIRTLLALFTTFFVVLGILLVGLAAMDSELKKSFSSNVEAEVKSVATSSAMIVLKNDKAIIRFLESNFSRDLVWPDDASKLGKPVSQIQGVFLDTGEKALIDPEFIVSKNNKFRSPDGRRDVIGIIKREDGSTVVKITYGKEESNYILRNNESEFLSNVNPIDWLNQYELVFFANDPDGKALYVLNLDGTVDELFGNINNSSLFTIGNDGIFYVEEIKPDEHLNEKQYKYNIWYAKNGTSTKIVNDNEVAIQSMVGFEDGLVYALADQKMFLFQNGKSVYLEKGIPLQVVDDKLIFRINGQINLLDIKTKQAIVIDDLEYNSAVFYLSDAVLD